MLGIVISFFLHLSPQYLKNYNASLIDKVQRLKSIEGPKIVLISNSNLAFGIKSEEIEKAFGMPVVNMGLHGGAGNVFHERMARLNVHEGDIYIISHITFDDDGQISPSQADLIWITIEDHFELWKLLRPVDIKPMFRAYPVYLKKCISLWLDHSGNQPSGNVYGREAFNEYGDIVWEDNGLEYEFQAWDVSVPGISDEVVERLNELNQYLTERGAKLLITAYPIVDNQFTPDRELYNEFQMELGSRLDAEIISDYRDYIYPESYFFNSFSHLNNVGKEVRTQQLISDLKEYMDSQ